MKRKKRMVSHFKMAVHDNHSFGIIQRIIFLFERVHSFILPLKKKNSRRITQEEEEASFKLESILNKKKV